MPAILADAGSVWLVYEYSKRVRFDHAAIVLMAACPISIFVSGFHGQLDPVMVFFLLLSIYLLEITQNLWLAGIAFGMSIGIKVVPICFAPAIFLYLPNMRERVAFFLSAALCFVALCLPYLLMEPLTILKAMFGYGSIFGAWGWTRLVVWISGTEPHINGDIYQLIPAFNVLSTVGRCVMIIVLCAVSFLLNRSANRPSLFFQCGLLAFLFMFLTPGYGIQYQSWLVPWTVALGVRPQMIYYLVGSIYVSAEYLCWAYQDAYRATCLTRNLSPFGIACWLAILIVLIFYGIAFKRIKSERIIESPRGLRTPHC